MTKHYTKYIVKYKLVTAGAPEDLEMAVNALIDDGTWTPFGSAAINNMYWMQPMVMYEYGY